MKWKFSTFTSLTDTRAVTKEMTFDELVKGFTTPWKNKMVKEKKDLPLWSPTTFQNGRRSGANAERIWFLVYDMDDGMAPFDTWRLFHEYNVIAHTSYSHRPYHHKYRIILPLEDPIHASDWVRASKAASNLWNNVVGRGEPDPSALNDRARAYFRFGLPSPEGDIPAHHPLFPSEFHDVAWNVGKSLKLDFSDIPEEKKPVGRPVKQPRHVYQNGKTSMSQMMEDSAVRLAIANRLGATIQGNEARYITCPGCGKNSVHYSIDISNPCSSKWPNCNHKNNCGWWGTFEMLIDDMKF